MVSSSHAYARRAHVSNRSFVFLLSQVSHMRKKRENEKKNSAKRKYGTLDFNVVSFVYECSIRLFVKTLQD